jgi:hypothetical protein
MAVIDLIIKKIEHLNSRSLTEVMQGLANLPLDPCQPAIAAVLGSLCEKATIDLEKLDLKQLLSVLHSV